MQLMFDFSEPVKKDKPDFEIFHKLTDDELVHVGRELSFQELEDMIGEKVLMMYNYQFNPDRPVDNPYFVVQINDYYKDCEKVYKRIDSNNKDYGHYGTFLHGYVYSLMDEKAKPLYELLGTSDQVAYSCSPKRPKSTEFQMNEMHCNKSKWGKISEHCNSFFEII